MLRVEVTFAVLLLPLGLRPFLRLVGALVTLPASVVVVGLGVSYLAESRNFFSLPSLNILEPRAWKIDFSCADPGSQCRDVCWHAVHFPVKFASSLFPGEVLQIDSCLIHALVAPGRFCFCSPLALVCFPLFHVVVVH